jgi:amino acid transporter
MSSATPAAARQASDAPQLKRELGVRDLTLFAVACVTAARWVPIAAHAGFASLTLWLLAGLLFLIPLTIAVAALVAKYPGAGGLYVWTREDFGPWNGFVSFWLYWIGIAFLFPTAALLYTKVGFSLLGPTYASLGENRYWLLGATLVLVWVGIGSNLFGLNVGKWTENAGAIATWAVGLVFVLVGWMVWRRRGFATAPHIVPSLQWGTISFWAAIAYAMSGMEGPGMMAGETHDPERTMRRAGWIASAFTAGFYVITTAALLVVLPPEKISELNGFVDVGNSAAELLRASWLTPVIAVLVLASGAGLIGGLGTATSRLPFAAGVDGLLPKVFGKVHPRWRTPWVATLTLAGVATFLLVAYQLGDSLRAAYDELVSMMVITGFIPYVYVFASSWKAGKRLSAFSGMAITGLALVCSVIPPSEISNVWLFEGKIVAGSVLIVGAAWIAYRDAQARRAQFTAA